MDSANAKGQELIYITLALCCFITKTATPWTAARQVPPFFSISWSLLKLMSIEQVIPSNHLILCHPLFLPSVFLSIRIFSNETAFCIKPGGATKKHFDKSQHSFLTQDGSSFQSLPSTCLSRLNSCPQLKCICKPRFVYLPCSLMNLTRVPNKRYLPTVR